MASDTKSGVAAENLAGTETERNLHTALSGEAQAYLRYKWFEKKAQKDGYVSVSRLFRDIAANEMEHAEIWFRYLGGYSSTERNLDVAASGEHFEWASMYAEFEQTARREGFFAIADLFAQVAAIEKQHEQSYLQRYETIKDGKMFVGDSAETKWICLNCGHIAVGKEPPKVCPTCMHPQGYFQLFEGA